MQTPDCTQTPTAAQTLGAVPVRPGRQRRRLQVRRAADATAAGYVPITNPAYPVCTTSNVSDMKTQEHLGPEPRRLHSSTPPHRTGRCSWPPCSSCPAGGRPMPYGCLVQWHAHTNLCRSSATPDQRFQPCGSRIHPRGDHTDDDHVWQVPSPAARSPSTPRPPVVEARSWPARGAGPGDIAGGTPTFETTSTHSTP